MRARWLTIWESGLRSNRSRRDIECDVATSGASFQRLQSGYDRRESAVSSARHGSDGLSNKFGSLVLTTGNKSEIAVGYCTLYGDMCGGLAVISDVPKTMVYRLARIANCRYRKRGLPAPIPENTILKAPSAELRPDQKGYR